MESAELDRRFDYHAPDDAKRVEHAQARNAAKAFARSLDALPECREKSLALTKIEEAMFWANAVIARY